MLTTISGIAVSILFASAATFNAFDTTLPAPLATLPLSLPLANGTMEIQCPPDIGPVCFVRGCCSNNAILDIAIVYLCRVPFVSDSEQAWTQYRINHQIALCHFDGHSVDNMQLLLTPNASALLDSMNRQNKRV
ncbi:hypothetical protein JB92DRAFT_2848331 [Gautieria morchelliformis]|nr:hypothetical protein JB92DRAFT_2848331 [Gautieria morchelliformis]